MIKRHTKKNPAKQIAGGIAEKEGPIAVSNVMILCPKCGPVRIGHHIEHAAGVKRAARVFAASADRRSTRRNKRSKRLLRPWQRDSENITLNSGTALTKEFGYNNVMAVPKVEKVSINIGLGEATGNAKLMDGAVNELTQIAGQKR